MSGYTVVYGTTLSEALELGLYRIVTRPMYFQIKGADGKAVLCPVGPKKNPGSNTQTAHPIVSLHLSES